MLLVNFRLKKSLVGIVALCVVSFVVLAVLFSTVKTNPKGSDTLDRLAYLSKLGYSIDDGSEIETQIKIPKDFSEIYVEYNDTQKDAGVNLTEYSGQDATMYTYSINNYKDFKGVYANLIVVKDRIVGGDISSIENGGFTLPLVEINKQ